MYWVIKELFAFFLYFFAVDICRSVTCSPRSALCIDACSFAACSVQTVKLSVVAGCVLFQRSGFIGQQRLRSVFLAMKVPVELDLLRELILA